MNIQKMLDYLTDDESYNVNCNDGSYYLELPMREAYELKDCIMNLQQEIQRKDNNWNELKKWLNEPHITYSLDASEFGIEKIECVSVKDTLNKIKELESK